MKINFFKKEKSFKKEDVWLDINPYWKLAVSFVFITAILSIAYGYYLFMQINEEFIPSANTSSGQFETIKKERIGKVLEYFSMRKQRSAEILNSSSPVVDPSL